MIRTALQRRSSLRALRPGQQALIDPVLARSDTLAVMPTGTGKALCWQLPEVATRCRVLVISPLVAVMKDQREHLAERGVAGQELHSAPPASMQVAALAAWLYGCCRVQLTSPERAVGE